MLIGNDDRARTTHTVAADTDRELFPTIVAGLLDRNDQRRAERAQAWRWHTAQNRARDAGLPTLDRRHSRHAAQRHRSRIRARDQGTVSNCKTRKRLFSGFWPASTSQSLPWRLPPADAPVRRHESPQTRREPYQFTREQSSLTAGGETFRTAIKEPPAFLSASRERFVGRVRVTSLLV